jgi:hypothetical protein
VFALYSPERRAAVKRSLPDALGRTYFRFVWFVSERSSRARGETHNGKQHSLPVENKIPVNLVEKNSKGASRMTGKFGRCEKTLNTCHSERSEESAFRVGRATKADPSLRSG